MTKENVLLVDTDVLCYGMAFRNQKNVDWDGDGEVEAYADANKAVLEVDSFIDDLKRDLKGTDVILVLSEYPGFRAQLDETYKANRKTEKPILWQTIRDHIEFGDHGWDVKSWPRLEGDDVLGLLHTSPVFAGRSTIVTIDKDLNTIPGRCYFWNHADEGIVEISEQEALHFHLTQVITGDTVDNYKGCPGAGPKKAEAMLDVDMTPDEMWQAVVQVYEEAALKATAKGREPPFTDPEAAALHQARLAYILRHGDYNFQTAKVRLWSKKRLHRS